MKKNNIVLILAILISILGWVLVPKSWLRKVMWFNITRMMPAQDYSWSTCGTSCGIEIFGKVDSKIGPNQLEVELNKKKYKLVFIGNEDRDLYYVDEGCREMSIQCRPREHINWNEVNEGGRIRVLVESEMDGVLYGRTIYSLR